MPVDRLTGNMLQTGGIGRVARQIAAAVMRFGEDDVVDVLRQQHRGDQRLGGVLTRPP
jgi:hypothetical protein